MRTLLLLMLVLSVLGAKSQTYTHQQLLDSLKKEDPGVITDFDRILASRYNILSPADCMPCTDARSKIDGIEYAHKKRADDSVRAIAYQKRQKDIAAANDKELKELTKEYGATIAKRMLKNQAWIGMTDKMCLREFTDPNERKTTYTKHGKTEVWIYQGRAEGCVGSGCPDLDYIITFQNHKAIAITTGN